MRRRLAAVAATTTLLLGGCGVLSGGVYDTPLPGGADIGDHPVTLTADFSDVLDLVPQSSVKVNDIAVGRVSEIDLNPGGASAKVTLLVNGATALPAGTSARLEQTSLLGEKYVALVRPETPVVGPELVSGDEIGLAKTSQAAEVEQVLGALSLVLNGGGIGQFQEISRELQQVSSGRPEQIKGFLEEMNTFIGGLDDRKEAITAALDGLADLSTTLEADQDKIVTALDGLSPGLDVLADQRTQLVSMLTALDRLSDVTVDTLDAAQDDIVADLQALEPIVTQLAKSGENLPKSLQILLTYPFPDSVLGAIKGDYLNVFIETNFRTLPAGCGAIGCAWPQLTQNTPAPMGVGPTTVAPDSDDEADVPPPSLLPPTSSPMPGIPSPTMPVPTRAPGSSPFTPDPSPTPSTSVTPSPPATPREGDN